MNRYNYALPTWQSGNLATWQPCHIATSPYGTSTTQRIRRRAAMAEPVSNAGPNDTLGLLRSDDAAKLLAISPRTRWTLTDDGEIPLVRVGRSVRCDPTNLQVYIGRQKHWKAGKVLC